MTELFSIYLLAQDGWSLEIGSNLLTVLLAIVAGVPGIVASYLAYRSILASKESKVEARKTRRVSTKAAAVVEEIKKEVAALPEIKKDVNSNASKMAEALKVSDGRLEIANEKIERMSELLFSAKTEQVQADRDRAIVQKVNGAKHAEPPPMPSATIVNVEEMHVEADAVSIDQKEKK